MSSRVTTALVTVPLVTVPPGGLVRGFQIVDQWAQSICLSRLSSLIKGV